MRVFILGCLGCLSLGASLPPGPNQALVQVLCTSCHGVDLLLQQRLSRFEWDKSLVLMEKEHNMPVLPAKMREKVLNYLASTLGPKPINRDPIDGLSLRLLNPLPRKM